MVNNAVWDTYIELGSTAYEHGHYDVADRMLEAALEEVQRVGQKDAPLTSVFNKLAYIYYQQKNYKKAESVYKRALTLYERILPQDSPHLANIMLNLAELYFSLQKYLQAGPLLERWIAIVKKEHGPDYPLLERRLVKLAWVYCLQERYDEAHELYKQAQAIRERTESKPANPFGTPVF